MFSAVLSAFLLATYTNLQEDPSDKMLQVLERIAAQTSSYEVQSNVLNSTLASTPFAFLPFEPSTNDIRINVLWFASLILSLVTASFGILVKQWLREYMAVENPSPQARLRVRHVRYPELKRWRVFEIAAALPLLLQLALGLFFIGLCCLTVSVHPSVASVTLPLVIGWVLCFVSATFMPILFPRCPFKTRFLKSFLVVIRQRSLDWFRSFHLWFMRVVVIPLNSPFSQWIIDNIVGPLRTVESTASNSHNYEADAISDHSADLTILIAVDRIQSNDELLATAIADTLMQVKTPLEMCLRFIVSVLDNRLTSIDVQPNTGYPRVNDFSRLPSPLTTAVVNILIPTMSSSTNFDDDDTKRFQTPSYASAFATLLSLPTTDSPRALAFLRNALLQHGRVIYDMIVNLYDTQTSEPQDTGECIPKIFALFAHVSTRLQIPFDAALVHLETICGAATALRPDGLLPLPGHVCLRISADVIGDPYWDYFKTQGIVECFFALIVTECRTLRTDRSHSVPSRLASDLVWWLRVLPDKYLEPESEKSAILIELFYQCGLRSGETLVDLILGTPFTPPFWNVRYTDGCIVQRIAQKHDRWFTVSIRSNICVIYARLIVSIFDQVKGATIDFDGVIQAIDKKRDLSRNQLLQLCLFFIWAARPPYVAEYTPMWVSLWNRIVDKVRSSWTPESSSYDVHRLADKCLDTIEEQESNASAFLGRIFDPTVFSHELLEELRRYSYNSFWARGSRYDRFVGNQWGGRPSDSLWRPRGKAAKEEEVKASLTVGRTVLTVRSGADESKGAQVVLAEGSGAAHSMPSTTIQPETRTMDQPLRDISQDVGEVDLAGSSLTKGAQVGLAKESSVASSTSSSTSQAEMRMPQPEAPPLGDTAPGSNEVDPAT